MVFGQVIIGSNAPTADVVVKIISAPKENLITLSAKVARPWPLRRVPDG
jgi:hypothetical protein